MSMLGHYTKLFDDIGALKIRDAVPENDYPDQLPKDFENLNIGYTYPTTTVDNPLAFYQANGSTYMWEYIVEERYEKAPKGVIHIGCHDMPERGCYVPLFGENVIWIEANKQSYDQWTVPIAKHFNHFAFNIAASDKTGTGSYYNNGSSEVSGLLPAAGQFPSSVPVPEKRFDDLVREYDIDMSKYDFLNVDVEGAEYKVLRGFEDNIKHINYLFIEVANYERNNGQVLFDDITKYIEKFGFKLNRVSDSINTLGWGDAFYVRN
tara:strand:- start:8712 stop:9503 length:792 start_codon:yes stop_codon:yes gene_type:complete